MMYVALLTLVSSWGGAHNRFVPPLDNGEKDPIAFRDHRFSLETQDHMTGLAALEPAAGVTCMPALEYIEASPLPPEYAALNVGRATELGIRNYRLLRTEELPAGVAWGCGYDTWCVNPMVYCSWLLRKFVRAGGKIQRKELRTVEEVWGLPGFADVSAVVNCSGVGFGDKDVFVTRGQTCLVAEPCDKTVTRQNADGSWTFCVPRNFDGGTIIGGTKQPNDWSVEPSMAVREELVSKFVATYPAILPEGAKSLSVRADVVGRRPTRKGGIRLERETIDVGGKKREVVHAYGLGGRGFELSWGVAGAVGKLVKEVVV
jgi:D-amino-acid oxidase